MTKVIGQLKSVWPDRTQYKPYSYNLEMQNVFVEIDVPDDHIRSIENDKETDYVLDLDGFTCLLGTIADGLDRMHKESLRIRNSGEDVRRNGAI